MPNEATSSTSTLDISSNPGGKVKQTRRRQRLSCVECTKRRQALAAQAQNNTVEALLARVSDLEEALRQKEKEQRTIPSLSTSTIGYPSRNGNSESGNASSPDEERWSSSDPSRSPTGSLKQSPDGPVALIDHDVQIAAVALAQLSLAPKTEYVGAGSVVCAIHGLGDPEVCTFSYASSMTTRTRMKKPDDHPIVSPVRFLFAQLPPRHQVEELIDIFFLTRNVEFGISEAWFRAATQTMWWYADQECVPGCPSNGSCPSCQEEVNPHWLSLFFALLAVTPFENGSQMRASFFSNALAARRLIEDILHASPAMTSDESLVGSVLSCLASVVLAAYLADHSRVSEAWKVVGSALRWAQALGLHRDTQWRRWEHMGAVEKDLRILTWWLLVSADRKFSFILGRPVMTQCGTFETAAPSAAQYGDGSPNPHTLFLKYMCKLSGIISDSTMRCLQWEYPTYRTISELGERYKKWEEELPARFRWRVSPNSKHIPDDDAPPTPPRLLAYQRVLLCAWSLDTAMAIHRIYLMETPPSSAHPDVLKIRRKKHRSNPARECCIALAIELTRVLVQFHAESAHWPPRERMTPTLLPFFMFDGAVTLAGALSQVPPHPQAAECLRLLRAAMRSLDEIAMMVEPGVDGEGQTAKRANVVLRALVKAGGWDTRDLERVPFDTHSLMGSSMSRIPSDGQGVSLRGSSSSSSSPSPELYSSYPLQSNLGVPQQTYQDSRSSQGSRLSNRPSPPRSSGSPQSNLPTPPVYSAPTAYNMYSQNPGDFGSLPEQFSGPAPGGSAVDAPPSMIMPYDLLQNTSSSAPAGFDMDWARLAGMDSHWYAGGSGVDDGQRPTYGSGR
ncbi:Oaf3p [Steccherinum ochraceum]|uniref:Oaf3p n=1 Tax=Steccherinum ochraceum TaxID=92696 RepID=A0A4R0RFX7_9APHY|nr:Oaf3p [Steccherinum ochraceum]